MASFRPLRHRDFALLWSAGLVSNAGTWLETVAVGTLVVHQTGRASWAGLAAAAAFLPIGVLSPIGGALADRLPRRPFLVVGYLVSGALAATLALLAAAGRATPGLVVSVVFLAGCTSALVFPFQQAVLPELVPRADLLGAVSLGSASYNLGRVVGPALAGLVVAAGSFTWAFAINAVSFMAVVGAVAIIRFRRPAGGHGRGLLASIVDGAREAWRVEECRTAIGLIAAAAFLLAPFIALVPAMADLHTRAGGAGELAAATGLLVTVHGIGAILGALSMAPVAERWGRARAVLVVLVSCPVALVVYAAAPSLALAAAALVVVGGLYSGILNGLGSTVQLHAPEAFRGRIVSLFFVALGVAYPIGALLQGAVADRVGLRETTVAGGLLMLGALGVARPRIFLAAARRPKSLAHGDRLA